MFVKQIETNVQSPTGAPYSFSLGRLTLLTGRNGSGKSALSSAVRLALTGTTDANGREEIKDLQVFRQMLPPDSGAQSLFAKATLDDDTVSTWTAKVEETGKVKRPVFEPSDSVDPAKALIMREVVDLLRSDEKIARRTLLGWIGQQATEEDVLALIPTDYHPRYRDIAERQKGSPVEALAATVDYVTKRAREIEAEATAQDRLIEQMGGDLPMRPSEEDLQSARDLVSQWRNLLVQAQAWRAPADPGKIANAEHAAAEAQAAVNLWQTECERAGAHGLSAQLLTNDVCSTGVCPTCGATPGREALLAWKGYHTDQVTPGAWESLSAWHTILSQAVAELRWLQPTDEALPPVPLEECEVAVRAAEAHLSTLERAAGAWDTVTRAKQTAASLRADKPVYVAMAAACNQAVGRLLDSIVQEFCVRAQNYLPERWKITLEVLDDLGNATFRLGFQRNGVIHTILSNTERDALIVAVAMAVADIGGGVSLHKRRGRKKAGADVPPFSLVIPSDCNRDPETLGELLRCWQKFSGQVIVEAATLPKGRLSKEWTHIDMEAWKTGSASTGEPAKDPEDTGPTSYDLIGLGFTPEEAQKLLPTGEVARRIVEDKVPRKRVLLTEARVTVFDKSAKPEWSEEL